MYKNLREFVVRLEAEGELVRVKAQVDPILEIAEITDRISKGPGGGKALLFENTGTGFPVVTNIFGSDRRIAMALGVNDIEDIVVRMDGLVREVLSPKGSLSEKIQVLPVLGAASRWFPKSVSGRGECQQVVLTGEDARLSQMPILKCWPYDGGRFVTLPMVNTLDPDTGARNVGMYRMQVFDDHTTGMHWHIHKTGARHYEAYKRRGERMPVSVCIGGDPAYTYSAVAPMPDGIDEYLLAGFLRKKPVRLVKCITNDLRVPADCDFVIEGYVDPAEEKVTEGPFGDHTGFYSLEDSYPRFHVTAITHRRDAVYPATIVGIPPQEDCYIAKATERIFLVPIRMVMQPEIKDLYMPLSGVAHNLAIVNIDIRYPGQAGKVASSMWGAGQMMFNKYMLITSTDKDVRDPETMAALFRGTDIGSAVIPGSGILDILDHAATTPGMGGKLALDMSAAVETPENEAPALADGREDGSLFPKWGIVVLLAAPGEEVDARGFIDNFKAAGLKVVVIADEAAEGMGAEDLLWFVTASTDAARDIDIYKGAAIVDGRTKLPGRNGYPARTPNVVTSSAETIALVDSRWAEYGIGDFTESPSLEYSRLIISGKAEGLIENISLGND